MHIKNINPVKLSFEFAKQGVKPLLIENDLIENEYIAENTWITFNEGTNMDLVQRIIHEHDTTPLPQQPTETEMLMDYVVDVDFRVVLLELGLI